MVRWPDKRALALGVHSRSVTHDRLFRAIDAKDISWGSATAHFNLSNCGRKDIKQLLESQVRLLCSNMVISYSFCSKLLDGVG